MSSRQLKLASGRTVVVERLGEQHYLVWSKGTPLTEVQCTPLKSGRWYSRGSALSWSKTRGEAIQNGIVRNVKSARIDRKPLEDWTLEARAAIINTQQRIAANSEEVVAGMRFRDGDGLLEAVRPNERLPGDWWCRSVDCDSGLWSFSASDVLNKRFISANKENAHAGM